MVFWQQMLLPALTGWNYSCLPIVKTTGWLTARPDNWQGRIRRGGAEFELMLGRDMLAGLSVSSASICIKMIKIPVMTMKERALNYP